jgi:putative MFS transporter
MKTAGQLPELGYVIESIGFGWAQIRALLVGGGVWAADGAELLLIGSVTRAVNEEWGLSATQRGLVVSVVFFGVLLGNACSGHFGDQHGRRLPILVSYVGVSVFSLLSVLAFDFYSLVSLRVFVGIAFGVGQPAWNALSGEVAPNGRRLHMNAYGQMLFCLGELYSGFLIWCQDPTMRNLDWRKLVLLGAIPSAAFCVGAYLWLVESPSYLAIHGYREKALKSLRSLSRDNGHPDTLSVEFQTPMQATTAGWMASSDKVGMVFGPKLLFSTMTVCFTTFTLNFLFYGGLYAFPQVLPELEFEVTPAANLMVGAASEIPGYLCGIAIGLAMGRKRAMYVYLLGALVGTILFTYAASEARGHSRGTMPMWIEVAAMAGMVMNKLFTSVGFLIAYLYSIEIYPTIARTTGTAVCLASGRLGAMSCPLAYEYLAESTGTHTSYFYLMTGLCLMNTSLVFFLPFETAGRTLKDHLDEYDETKPLRP